MKWVARVLRMLIRRRPAVNGEIARSRATRAVAEIKRAHTQSLWPQSEQAHDDLEWLVEQALRGREDA